MSVTSGFFNSLQGDRRYTAKQFSAIIDSLIVDGVLSSIGNAFALTANGTDTITVGTGRCWFNSTWLYNDTLLPMKVRTSEILLDRIDAVVIEVNHNEAVRSASIRFVYGTAATEPVRPELTNNDLVHQYPLAYIYRHAGIDTVKQADITNMIGTSACPFATGILETLSIDAIVAQWQNEFDIWFESLETELDGDIATNLALRLIELQSRFKTLAKDQAVLEPLEDSSGNGILDSNGSQIQGSTVFALRGMVNTQKQVSSETEKEADPYEVGDILMTTREDLGARWALCNGEVMDRILYPNVAKVCPIHPDSVGWLVKELSIPEGVRSFTTPWNYGIVIGDFIAMPWRTLIDEKAIYLSIYNMKDDTYSCIKIDNTSSSSYDIELEGNNYLNGRYVIHGKKQLGSNNTVGMLWHSDDVNGPYASVNTSPASRVDDIAYYKDKYIIRYTKTLYTSSNLTGPYTQLSTFSVTSADVYVLGMNNFDGNLVVYGYTKSSNNYYNVLIWYLSETSDISKSFSSAAVGNSLSHSIRDVDMRYVNGHRIIFRVYGVLSSFTSVDIYYSTTDLKTWKLAYTFGDGTVHYTGPSIDFIEGYWVLSIYEGGESQLFYSKELSGPWTRSRFFHDSVETETNELDSIQCIQTNSAHKQSIVGIRVGSEYKLSIADNSKFRLPLIPSTDYERAYIRLIK